MCWCAGAWLIGCYAGVGVLVSGCAYYCYMGGGGGGGVLMCGCSWCMCGAGVLVSGCSNASMAKTVMQASVLKKEDARTLPTEHIIVNQDDHWYGTRDGYTRKENGMHCSRMFSLPLSLSHSHARTRTHAHNLETCLQSCCYICSADGQEWG